jgi:hypothetical protein
MCLNGAACNDSIGVGLFLHARLDSLEQLLDNITSPGKIRKRRALLGEIPQTLFFVRAFQQYHHVPDIDPIIGTNGQTKTTAFLIQLRYEVVFPNLTRQKKSWVDSGSGSLPSE